MNNPIDALDVINTIKCLLLNENASEDYQLGIMALGSELLNVSIDTIIELTVPK